jgi:5-aminolevulinate synthase
LRFGAAQADPGYVDRHRIYIQPVKHPTVPRGNELLRITPTPNDHDADIAHPVRALGEI